MRKILNIILIVLTGNFLIGQNQSNKVKTYEIYKNKNYELKYTIDNSNYTLKLIINSATVMTIDSLGNFSFGKAEPQYRLDVCGTIRASEEIIVETNDWCDEVFNIDYPLPSLENRLQSIKENRHLPYIKPEKEIINNGIPINETLKGILRNIEEMYLYIELLNDKINKLENENKELKEKCR